MFAFGGTKEGAGEGVFESKERRCGRRCCEVPKPFRSYQFEGTCFEVPKPFRSYQFEGKCSEVPEPYCSYQFEGECCDISKPKCSSQLSPSPNSKCAMQALRERCTCSALADVEVAQNVQYPFEGGAGLLRM